MIIWILNSIYLINEYEYNYCNHGNKLKQKRRQRIEMEVPSSINEERMGA